MLGLSRKVGEKILIGENISVTIVRVAQGMVRVGVEAPQELPIVREEIKGQGKKSKNKTNGSQAATQQNATETPAEASVAPNRR